MTQINPNQTVALGADDEINLGDLFRNLWQQRGLIIGVALFAVAAVFAFHLFKASFSTAYQVDYPISLTFLDSSNKYPNGSVFSPRDIIATGVLEATLKSNGLNLSVDKLEDALRVGASNSLLQKGEDQLNVLLNNVKIADEVRQTTLKALDDLQSKSRNFVTLSVDLNVLGLTPAQGTKLAQELVDTWATQSIARGLMNENISRPVAAFSYSDKANLIDTYDSAEEYASSLEATIKQLQKLSGASSMIVDGQSLSDISRDITSLKSTEISPLREFAYSNSSSLSTNNATISIRLSSRLRLLTLEHDRLVKLIAFYDNTLKQLASNDGAAVTAKPSNNMQASGAQFDQSFLVSLLDLGNKLGNVEVRDTIFKQRTNAMIDLLNLEKDIAFLRDTSLKPAAAAKIEGTLESALDGIESRLNHSQQQLNAFVVAYRTQALHSSGRLYIADAAPQVRGGGLQVAKKAVLTLALGLVLGLMLGVLIALIRSALAPKATA